MSIITIPEAQKVKTRLYKEKRYLSECLRTDAPDNVRKLLEGEITKRNNHIDIIEAAIDAKVKEMSQVTIFLPDGIT